MASAGRVLLIFKGDYDNAVQYQKMDAVAYQGSSYVCKQTTTGNAPTNTTYWQILARGATDALGLAYDNTESGLNAENVQDAIDELNSELTIEPIAFTPSPNLSSDINTGIKIEFLNNKLLILFNFFILSFSNLSSIIFLISSSILIFNFF